MTELKGKTLAELNVQPGDVVAHPVYWPGSFAVCEGMSKSLPLEYSFPDFIILPSEPGFTIIHRANPTRDQLDAQIAELTAQRDAMPSMVRAGVTVDGVNYYRDFPLIDGVPEGFEKIARQSDCAEVTK